MQNTHHTVEPPHTAQFGRDLHATYAAMNNGDIDYEHGIAALGRIHDQHLAACRKAFLANRAHTN